jgi:PAS domain S-box-containing protein
VIVAHREEDGKVAFFSTVARDITEQKHTEHHLWTLLKNYQDLKYAIDESTIFAVTDVQGRILDVNDRFCEVAGYRREEMIGKDHRLLNSGFHPKGFFKDMWDTLLAGRVWRGEIRNRAKDGSIYWVDATFVPWLGADGRPERFIALRSVITDRKLAEEKVRRRETQLEVLLRTSRDLNADLEIPAVFRKLVRSAVQLAGAKSGAAGLHENGKVKFTEYFTDGAWKPVDYQFAPGRGVPGHVLESGEAYITNDACGDPHVLPEIQQALGYQRLIDVPILDRSGAILGCFEVHDTLDGRPFGEEDLWVLRGLADAASVALHNARMIAEQDRQEAALRHVQKIESLGVLASGIAHDFNNLLAVISGNVALAQMNSRGGPEDAFLASIDETVQRAADLTRQLMAYAGKGKSTAVALDLNRVVEEMSKLLAVSCSKKAELELQLESGLPAILADPAQIQQVVMNLVINASDALEGRAGRILITTGLREIAAGSPLRDAQGGALPAGRHVVLSVSDSGCGMSPEVQALIFDPFFSTKATGRGLGLSAMQGILRSHGARIQLESAPGAGSTFTVYFRPGTEAEAQPERRPGGAEWKGSGRLLLVDDEEQIRHAIAPLLRHLGFEVVEAAHGREAVTRYQREGPFRLILMDLSMPHMDGLEAFREIRSLDPAAKAIILSGYDPGATLGAEPGLAGFLQKPFRLDRLKEALRKALEGA